MSHPKVTHPKDVTREHIPSKFSNALVVNHAKVLGSIGFIYTCYVLDFILFLVLCQQTYQDLSGKITFVVVQTLISLWVVFIAQTYVQFVALPILQNYQNRQSENDAIKADVDHQAMTHIAIITDENSKDIKDIKATLEEWYAKIWGAKEEKQKVR